MVDPVFLGAICALAAVAEEEEEAGQNDNNRGPRAWIRRQHVAEVDVNGFRTLPDPGFEDQFRLTRPQFERLLEFLGNYMIARGTLLRVRQGLDLRLMMVLCILGTQDTFSSVAVKFGIASRSSVHKHYKRIIQALREMSIYFIQWPKQFERDNIKAALERKYGYPGVVGCVDGSHIYISAPVVQPQRYVNRFSCHSILLQAVCDDKMVFRDIHVGEPGSVHDARMFQRSPLHENLLRNPEALSHGEHILGDGAYMLTDKVMTPYRDNGRLTRKERRHNYFHASTRSIIERAFALDKNRWRRQKLMLIYDPHYLVDHVVASCVLHNFILLDGVPYLDIRDGLQALQAHAHGRQGGVQEQEPEDEDPHDPGDFNDIDIAVNDNNRLGGPAQIPLLPEHDPLLQMARRNGREKRDFIAHMLHPHAE